MCIGAIIRDYRTKRRLRKCNMKNTNRIRFGSERILCKVVSVYDGDTITVVMIYRDVETKFSVRLLDIDTEEMKDSDPSRKQKAVEARDYLRTIVLDKFVYLAVDDTEKDPHGRLLSRVYLSRRSSKSVNQMMIDMGYSEFYDGKKKKAKNAKRVRAQKQK